MEYESKIPRVLDVKDVAEALHLNTNKVYSMVKAGEIKAFTVGNRYRFREEDVLDFIEKRST
jgi:excisionase family DNA binding protein